MAREYARIKVGIWADSDFRLLSRDGQGLYFQITSSPTMNLAGVADWRPKRLAALTAGETDDTVQAAGRELIEKGYIVVDEDTEEVLVRSFVRHDGLIKTPNIAAAMVKDYAGVASRVLRGVIIHELLRLHVEEPEMKGWSTASKLLREPSIDPSSIPSPQMPSVNPSPMALPIPSGNESHIPQPSSLIQQPAAHSPKKPEPEGFSDFWAAYPRREDKGHARTAWVKAVRKADVRTIVAGAARLRDDPNREKQFTPLPATWLNGERWGDDPLPPRGGRTVDPAGDMLQSQLAAARARDEAVDTLRISA